MYVVHRLAAWVMRKFKSFNQALDYRTPREAFVEAAACGYVDVCRRGTKEVLDELKSWREAAQKMMVGPSGSAFRSRSQTGPSCCDQKSRW